MTTVIDALLNAQCNLATLGGMMGSDEHPLLQIARRQLANGIKALENGMAPNDVLQEHLFCEVNTGTNSDE